MDAIRDWSGGLIRLNVWSFAVPAAIISGYWFALRRARQAGIASKEFESAMEWCIGGGLLISHMVEILLYQPHRLKAEGPLTLLKFWDGLSSYGGFFGGVLMLTIFYRVLRKRSWWLEGDCLMQGMILAWIFGRFGCTMSGDHPGPLTSVPWAFHYPDGGRHNMGMYEMAYTIVVLFPANLLLYRFKPPTGSFIAMNCLLYGAGRFALDFLRATDRTDSDPRYFGLTLAHYLSGGIFLFGVLVAVLAKTRKLGPAAPPPAAPAAP
jgi:phosphatidylglycerol:prolipoprotein diacylglycerol transferase